MRLVGYVAGAGESCWTKIGVSGLSSKQYRASTDCLSKFDPSKLQTRPRLDYWGYATEATGALD